MILEDLKFKKQTWCLIFLIYLILKLVWPKVIPNISLFQTETEEIFAFDLF
jgi:hypothetical protein